MMCALFFRNESVLFFYHIGFGDDVMQTSFIFCEADHQITNTKCYRTDYVSQISNNGGFDIQIITIFVDNF